MKLIFEKSVNGRNAVSLPKLDVEEYKLGSTKKIDLPEIAEIDLVRHYTNLSRNAFGVDNGFYPLGSCTMKYNPKVNEDIANLEGFTKIHPLQPIETAQGCLRAMYETQEILGEIAGMQAVSLQPSAGAHGEYSALLTIKEYFKAKGETQRDKIIVPDSAHGTNPASATACGFEIINIPSNEKNLVDLEALKSVVGEDTAGLMLTNPNTLGLFEEEILEIVEIVHNAGGKLYYDGANLNAIMGVVRPGDMGFDIMHYNVHKTLSTPHGGGGPGAGPIACKKDLKEFLPKPLINKDENGKYYFYNSENSLGKVKSFYGNFLVLLKSLAYTLTLGAEGVTKSAQVATLNANYMLRNLEDKVESMYKDVPCMHEFVLSFEKIKKETGVAVLDIAKGMIDNNLHPPTIYFPLIVHEAGMFEPTETESVETLDNSIKVIKELIDIAYKDADYLHNCPHNAVIKRPDEVKAARDTKLIYKK